MCSAMRLGLCDNRDATVSTRRWQCDNRDVQCDACTESTDASRIIAVRAYGSVHHVHDNM